MKIADKAGNEMIKNKIKDVFSADWVLADELWVQIYF